MDYDKTSLACTYDLGRGYDPETLSHWMEIISRSVGERTILNILDLGCGTGRYSAALASTFGATVFGLYPSKTMLAEALKKPQNERVQYLHGRGEEIPLPDSSVDMVFISMAFHHFADRPRVIAECRRVLRESGTVCLRGGTTDELDTYPYVPFFPRTAAIFQQVLHSRKEIEELFKQCGFRTGFYELVTSQVALNWPEYAEKIMHRADSVLIQLTNDEFQEGMAHLREYASLHPTEPVIEQIDYFCFHRA